MGLEKKSDLYLMDIQISFGFREKIRSVFNENTDQFLCLEKIRFENTNQILCLKESNLKNTDQFLCLEKISFEKYRSVFLVFLKKFC